MGAGPKRTAPCCGDTIQSQHRHDLVFCKCGASYIDGGSDYTRLGGEIAEMAAVENTTGGDLSATVYPAADTNGTITAGSTAKSVTRKQVKVVRFNQTAGGVREITEWIPGDRFWVGDNGFITIYKDGNVVAVFASGQWISAECIETTTTEWVPFVPPLINPAPPPFTPFTPWGGPTWVGPRGDNVFLCSTQCADAGHSTHRDVAAGYEAPVINSN